MADVPPPVTGAPPMRSSTAGKLPPRGVAPGLPPGAAPTPPGSPAPDTTKTPPRVLPAGLVNSPIMAARKAVSVSSLLQSPIINRAGASGAPRVPPSSPLAQSLSSPESQASTSPVSPMRPSPVTAPLSAPPTPVVVPAPAPAPAPSPAQAGTAAAPVASPMKAAAVPVGPPPANNAAANTVSSPPTTSMTAPAHATSPPQHMKSPSGSAQVKQPAMAAPSPSVQHSPTPPSAQSQPHSQPQSPSSASPSSPAAAASAPASPASPLAVSPHKSPATTAQTPPSQPHSPAVSAAAVAPRSVPVAIAAPGSPSQSFSGSPVPSSSSRKAQTLIGSRMSWQPQHGSPIKPTPAAAAKKSGADRDEVTRVMCDYMIAELERGIRLQKTPEFTDMMCTVNPDHTELIAAPLVLDVTHPSLGSAGATASAGSESPQQASSISSSAPGDANQAMGTLVRDTSRQVTYPLCTVDRVVDQRTPDGKLVLCVMFKPSEIKRDPVHFQCKDKNAFVNFIDGMGALLGNAPVTKERVADLRTIAEVFDITHEFGAPTVPPIPKL